MDKRNVRPPGSAWRVVSATATMLMFLIAAPSVPAGAGTGNIAALASPSTLTVEVLGANFALGGRELDIAVDLTPEARPPARIRLFVPRRFRLFPQRTLGAPVGKAYLYVRDPGSPSGSLMPYQGPISAEPVNPADEVAAQTCSPGVPTAIWRLHLRRGKQMLDLPVYLSQPTPEESPPGATLALDICPPPDGRQASPEGTRFRIAAIVLSLADLDAPTTPGTYRWSAFVTPTALDDATPDQLRTYELRALLPVPHKLTLRGQYIAGRSAAVLNGTLRARGRPMRDREVYLTRLKRIITPRGPRFDDTAAGIALTDHGGGYRLTVPLHATRGFLASTYATTARCSGAGTAPAGCRSTTTAGVESDPITISVP